MSASICTCQTTGYELCAATVHHDDDRRARRISFLVSLNMPNDTQSRETLRHTLKRVAESHGHNVNVTRYRPVAGGRP